MNLLSREQREGEPVACAYGCRIIPGGVRAGLLFVRSGLGPEPLTFFDPQSQNTFSLALPADYLDLDEDGYGERELLESR